jgi:hypothetical protein
MSMVLSAKTGFGKTMEGISRVNSFPSGAGSGGMKDAQKRLQ